MNEIVLYLDNWIAQPGSLPFANNVVLAENPFGFGTTMLVGVDPLATSHQDRQTNHHHHTEAYEIADSGLRDYEMFVPSILSAHRLTSG